MAYMINEECISCGACEPECPTGSISEADEIFVIDPETCEECKDEDLPEGSTRCSEICPVEACLQAE